MFKQNKIVVIMFLSILISLFIQNISYANSAKPPSILIIVPNAPDDLDISIVFEDTSIKDRKTDKVIEKCYTFYSSEIKRMQEYCLWIYNYKVAYIEIYYLRRKES